MAGAIGGHGRRSLSLGGNDRVLPVRPRRAAACGGGQRGLAGPLVGVATRYAFALVPLGFGMWLAHYSFPFLPSYDTAVPVAQRFAADLGLTSLGAPAWGCACCGPLTPWLLPLELLFLDVGLLLSLYTGYRLAPTLKAQAPWALLLVLLYPPGVSILFQPIDIRATL